MVDVCGSCRYYGEWINGYCKKISGYMKPEQSCCVLYEEVEDVPNLLHQKQTTELDNGRNRKGL